MQPTILDSKLETSDGAAKSELVKTHFCTSEVKDLNNAWRSSPVEAFEIWMETAKNGHGYRDKSQVVYLSMWRKLVKHAGSESAFLDAEKIQKFLNTVYARGGQSISPTQQRRYLVLLDAIQQNLTQQGILKHNAAREMLELQSMREAATRRSLPVALTPEQEHKINHILQAQAARVPLGWRMRRDTAMLAMFLGAGVKVNELQALCLSDLMKEGTGPLVVLVTTNGAKERRAPVAVYFESFLTSWSQWLIEQGAPGNLPLFISSSDENSALIDPDLEIDFSAGISWSHMRPMSSAQIWRVVQNVFVLAKLEDRLIRQGPTVLRNTFATRQLRMGVPLKKVSLWLGHKEINSTRVFESLLLGPGQRDVL